MEKVLSQLFLVSLAVGTTVLTMMFGWGLQPKSWWWIVGCGVFANTAIRLLANTLEEKKPPLSEKAQKQ